MTHDKVKTYIDKKIDRYKETLYILQDNQKHDRFTGYPYDSDIKTYKKFIAVLKDIRRMINQER